MNLQAEPATATPAQIYDSRFVPAVFAAWGPVVAEAAGVGRGQRVLDVACGTGALTLAVADRVGPEGAVTGLDPNPDMLAVARAKHAPVDWRSGTAEAMPFRDGSFDAVVSQFGMMFFTDAPASVREMMRVLRPGGRLAVAVCDAVERSPGYAAVAAMLERLFGRDVADAFRAPFALGDPQRLHAIFAEAGVPEAEVARRSGPVRFASIDALVSTERACVWTLGGLLDDAQFAELRAEAQHALRDFLQPDGTVAFEMPALIATARKR